MSPEAIRAAARLEQLRRHLTDSADAGYQFAGFSSGPTFGGRNELVTIMRRPRE
jgi:hypothetical protein